MDLQALLAHYEADQRTRKLVSHLKDTPPTRVFLKGLVGSSASVVATTIFRELPYSHLFILNDKEEAAYFLNDLQALLDKKDILFVPDSFKKPGHFEEQNSNNVLQRTEAVNRLFHPSGKGELIVTYPEAIFEKIVSPNALESQVLYMSKGEKLDMDFTIDVLVESGFEHVDFVYEPGQFSVRGGIVDIFSYGNEWPYRVSLFGEEVESISVFDPANQLSRKNVSKVTIVPNMQTQFDSSEKVSLLRSLPKNAVVWLKDAREMAGVIDKCKEKSTKLAQALREGGIANEDHLLVKHTSEELFIDNADLLAALEQHSTIEFGSVSHFKANAEVSEIEYKIEPQPAFNKQFDLLIDTFTRQQQNGYGNYLFAGNARQIERFRQIFNDLGAEMEYFPLPIALSKGFIDHELNLACFTDHQIFERFHKYAIRRGYSKSEALSIKALRELKPGDFVTHIDHGVGVYSGLEKIEVAGQLQEAVRLVYRDNDLLYVNINSLHKIAKYVGKEGTAPRLNKLGSEAWEKLKRRTKRKVKDIARDLIKLYAKRKAATGFAFSEDSYLQTELEASFIYEDTPDQLKSTLDVKRDMEAANPMDRLVCGDVGFGKTEIAIRAAFKAVADSKQVAVLVPTTILAMQHARTFAERLEKFPCKVDYLNRFKTSKQKKETLADLAAGKTDIIIGTHALIGKAVKFKDLGLLIIDEEQKFGVAAKEKLKNLKANVDTLTLTATPIPRTLKFSLMGARDLSVMNTAPPNRQPISTELRPIDPDIMREAIQYEVYRGGQVFFIHNRVKDIEKISEMIRKLCPDIDIGVAHGQMEGPVLEERMLKFINRQYDLLICTNIVESGLDIPNANTIIINNAQNFGLSDLHQLRGRVGRSNKKAFCYLFAPPMHTLSPDARKRLRTLEEFAGLGSGFNIAMRDMDIRGAGNLLGGEQSGFVADIGFEMYHKILDEAIQELKASDFKDLFADQLEEANQFVLDCQIDTDLEMLIPDKYVNSTAERLLLYKRLDDLTDESGLTTFREQMIDRFGPTPVQVEELFNGIRLRWMAMSLGFERIIFKSGRLRCYFVDSSKAAYYESKLFANILKYVQATPGCKMKQTPKYLILTFEPVHKMKSARKVLHGMSEALGLRVETPVNS